MPHNLERHPTKPAKYIAYDANGFAVCVQRARRGWYSRPSYIAAATDPRSFTARTLSAIAAQIGASRAVSA